MQICNSGSHFILDNYGLYFILEVSPLSKSEKLISNVIVLLGAAGTTPWFEDISAKRHAFGGGLMRWDHTDALERLSGPKSLRHARLRFFCLRSRYRRKASTPGQQNQSDDPFSSRISRLQLIIFSCGFVFLDRLVTLDKLTGPKSLLCQRIWASNFESLWKGRFTFLLHREMRFTFLLHREILEDFSLSQTVQIVLFVR